MTPGAVRGINLSVNRMLDILALADVKQVITVYPKRGESKKDRQSYKLRILQLLFVYSPMLNLKGNTDRLTNDITK